MVKQMLSETKQRHICQRCGGQVMRFYDDVSCLQCGATHTEEGELLSSCPAQEFESLPALQEMMLKAEVTQKFP